MASTKGKIASAVAAVGVAAAMALGGTFAWQSISQTALNEASDVVNPGGRLHDDFDGTNKDVYVENFADEPIIARIRLAEYFEIVMNKGAGAEKSVSILGSKSVADGKTTYSYETFKDYSSLKDGVVSAGLEATGTGEAATTHSWWSWKTGGSTVYMPTFNKNKDSLKADVNGVYMNGSVGAISDRDGTQYTEYVDWSTWKGENGTIGVGATKTGTEVYDADANDVEDENVTEAEATHAAKLTDGADLISMQAWIDAGAKPGSYWVYDTDGWVYWAQAIPGRNEDGTTNATGLLLDSIELNGVMDDTWYYAIDVTAQFATPDDVGYEDGTGFYGEGQEPSANAERLLRALGADIPASYMMSSTTPIDGYPDEDKVLFMEDPDSGITLTYVRVGDPVSPEDLNSSYFYRATMVSENGAGIPDQNQAVPVREVAQTCIGDKEQPDALMIGELFVMVVYDEGGCSLPNSDIKFPKAGVYMLHMGPEEALEAQGITSYAVELYEYVPDPDSVRYDYTGHDSLPAGMTATLSWGGTLVVSGSDLLGFDSADKAPWLGERAGIERVLVGDGFTSIGAGAFSGYDSLKSVDLPEGMTEIAPGAFEGCSGLVEVDLPDGLTSIGENAFSGCTSLKSVDLPEGMTEIAPGAFEGCSGLVEVDLPDGLTSIGENAFEGCASLKSVDLPEGMTEIAAGAFKGCASLKSVGLPEGVQSVGEGAFEGCKGLESVTFRGDVGTIGEDAFMGCTSLDSVEFQGEVGSIGEDAFTGCTSLDSVEFRGEVGSIGRLAFMDCPNLREVSFGEKVTAIGENAFYQCANLESVTFRGDVGTIGEDAFTDCASLKSVKFLGEVGSISRVAFDSCSSLSEVSFAKKVTEIGESAFSRCTNLESVTFQGDVGSVGLTAFYQSPSLKSVAFAGDVGSIGDRAFFGCGALTTVTFEGSVESIGRQAFAGCGGLKLINYSGTVIDWNSKALYASVPAEVTVKCSDGDHVTQ